jgi:hypothetical protein
MCVPISGLYHKAQDVNFVPLSDKSFDHLLSSSTLRLLMYPFLTSK